MYEVSCTKFSWDIKSMCLIYTRLDTQHYQKIKRTFSEHNDAHLSYHIQAETKYYHQFKARTSYKVSKSLSKIIN